MHPAPNLLEIARNRKPVAVVLSGIDSENPAESLAAGQRLTAAAKNSGLSLRDYCRLAIDPEAGDFKGSGLNGYEVALAHLRLPIKDDIDSGILLQAAAETFQFKPGTRAFFPEVIDDVIIWKYRQNQIETIVPFLANSRNTSSVELITRVVNDQQSDYQQTGVIAEGARVPVRSLSLDQKSVTFHKFGGGYEFTYEFQRRISLDVVTPYANRVQRELELGQVGIATSLLINGDGVNPAATVVNASALGATMANAPAISAGRMNWNIFLKLMINQAKAGVPVDTVTGNWDMYFEWERMFAQPYYNAGMTQMEVLAKAGVEAAIENPRFNQAVKFAVSSAMPENQLLGFVKGETIEELIENGSDIEESVRSIENQKVRYVRTKNAGYRLVFGDTRVLLNLDAVVAS